MPRNADLFHLGPQPETALKKWIWMVQTLRREWIRIRIGQTLVLFSLAKL